MDEKRIAEILQRVQEAEEQAEKTTEGPWETENCGEAVILSNGAILADVDVGENGIFIAAARSDVPFLCAAVRELAEENARLKKENAEIWAEMKARAK